MNIPETVRIGGVEYTVIDDYPALNDGSNLLYGQIDHNMSEIKLADLEVSYAMKVITLWHEILHGLVRHSNVNIENEEEVVEMFARGIYQVLADNENRFFNIVSDTDA